ncbi:hypothetical protein LJK87_04365 [Paenibacillus sp. P25]|nr:hypothetical protein LJK87_04365 [Paenibacillus sp. P25]
MTSAIRAAPGTGRKSLRLLMQELEKERDYDVLNLSMMHKNRLIEEVLFESEQVH